MSEKGENIVKSRNYEKIFFRVKEAFWGVLG